MFKLGQDFAEINKKIAKYKSENDDSKKYWWMAKKEYLSDLMHCIMSEQNKGE